MAHDHHHGETPRDYFVEQLLTIFVVGLFGGVAILMYQSGKLGIVLADPFHIPVLVGGVAVLVLVAVRALSVWKEAGAVQAYNHGHHHHDHDHGHDHHDHDHGHDHHHDDHGHEHHNHDHEHAHHHDHDHHTHTHDDHTAEDHGHSHDMAWVLARMMVLFFPVALFLIGVPSKGFSRAYQERLLGNTEGPLAASQLADIASKSGTVMSFADLNDAAFDAGKREAFQGKTAVLRGRFRRLADKEFTLFTLRRTCCSQDAVPLKVRIVAPYSLGGFNDFDWVEVKGQIQFVPVPNSQPTQYMVVIKANNEDIQKIPPQNEYE